MDNVLITGGTGFVGHWMKETCPENVDCVYLNHATYIMKAWRSWSWNYIVHLAPVAPYDVIRVVKTNNARLLYCSSGIVYHPENNTEYRRKKLNWEKYCLDSGVDVVIARLFTFYGEKLDGNKAYTTFTQAARQNSDIEIWGDGSTVRSYMHGSEMGRWLWAILLHGVSGEAYDVGDDQPVTMLELAKFIKAHYNSMSKITFRNQPEPMPFYLPKATKKTRALL